MLRINTDDLAGLIAKLESICFGSNLGQLQRIPKVTKPLIVETNPTEKGIALNDDDEEDPIDSDSESCYIRTVDSMDYRVREFEILGTPPLARKGVHEWEIALGIDHSKFPHLNSGLSTIVASLMNYREDNSQKQVTLVRKCTSITSSECWYFTTILHILGIFMYAGNYWKQDLQSSEFKYKLLTNLIKIFFPESKYNIEHTSDLIEVYVNGDGDDKILIAKIQITSPNESYQDSVEFKTFGIEELNKLNILICCTLFILNKIYDKL
jgi:hypothetical protein